jgi:TP901-1 family phage major tail protein
MARPTTYSAKKLLILLGDGGTPEVFAAPCGLTTRGIEFSKETNDVTVPDCDDPDLPAWTERSVRTLSASVSGSGILAAEAHATWRAAFLNTNSVNCRIKIDDTLGNGGGYYSGKFHLSAFSITGEIGDKLQVEITLDSDSDIVWTDAT